MKTELKKQPVPVLLGGDLNAYSVARAFFEEYGVVSHVFAAGRLGVTDNLEFIELHIVEGLSDVNVAVPALLDFSKEHSESELILVPCADWYMELVEFARDRLDGHFSFNIPSFELWRVVSDKVSFYRLLRKYGVTYPRYAYLRAGETLPKQCMSLKPPFVLKPSDSGEYHKYSFEGKEKVYFTDDLSEAKRHAQRIFDSGYSSRLIIQERVTAGSGEVLASVLTTYSSKEGKVVMACLADVLLEEPAPTARGNYSALITRPLTPLCRRLINMLDGLSYTGFANFDILTTAGEEVCLELNPRQGRSCDYLRGAGINIARLITEDLRGNSLPKINRYRRTLWHAVPLSTVMKYAKGEGLRQRARRLIAERRTSDAFLKGGVLKRRLYDLVHAYRQHRRFGKYLREV